MKRIFFLVLFCLLGMGVSAEKPVEDQCSEHCLECSNWGDYFACLDGCLHGAGL